MTFQWKQEQQTKLVERLKACKLAPKLLNGVVLKILRYRRFDELYSVFKRYSVMKVLTNKL